MNKAPLHPIREVKATLSAETAKKLKDAGFDQRLDSLQRKGIYFVNDEQELLYDPALSELIEACGNNFLQLIRGKGEWCAMSDKEGYGSTPEEAVANLYLALHPSAVVGKVFYNPPNSLISSAIEESLSARGDLKETS